MGTFSKLKQFKDLRTQAKTLQNALSGESASASAGGVTITMNGNQEVTSVAIEDSALTHKETLQNNIKDATNKTVKSVQKLMAEKMKDMGDFDISKMLGGK